MTETRTAVFNNQNPNYRAFCQATTRQRTVTRSRLGHVLRQSTYACKYREYRGNGKVHLAVVIAVTTSQRVSTHSHTHIHDHTHTKENSSNWLSPHWRKTPRTHMGAQTHTKQESSAVGCHRRESAHTHTREGGCACYLALRAVFWACQLVLVRTYFEHKALDSLSKDLAFSSQSSFRPTDKRSSHHHTQH